MHTHAHTHTLTTYSSKINIGEVCSSTQQGFMAFDNVTYSRNEVKGQLQLCMNRRWSAVCSLPDGFTEINSEVACYQMGFSGERANSTRGESSLTTTWMYNVVCQGNEETLLNCSYSTPNDTVQHMCLTKSQSVHIICSSEYMYVRMYVICYNEYIHITLCFCTVCTVCVYLMYCVYTDVGKMCICLVRMYTCRCLVLSEF